MVLFAMSIKMLVNVKIKIHMLGFILSCAYILILKAL